MAGSGRDGPVPRPTRPDPTPRGRAVPTSIRFPLRKVVAVLAGSLAGPASRGADRVDYERQVKPILRARCYACHGALQQKGGLRVDTARSLLEGGDGGPAVVPGSSV